MEKEPVLIRDDMSTRLIHLTRDHEGGPTASETLRAILEEGKLRGGTGEIFNGIRCVCFSEAPISKLGTILQKPSVHGFPYGPYGVMVSKEWLFRQGGRPVIYQTDQEVEILPPELHFRHKVYNPPAVDFTWEREWRIEAFDLELDPDETTVIIPTRDWAEKEKDAYASKAARAMSVLHCPMPRVFLKDPWHYIALEDLGVGIPSS